MDFLNKAWTQLTDLFRSMTPGARVTAGLLLAVLAISLTFLLRSHVSSPDEYLLAGASFEMDATLKAFSKANLDTYVVEGSRIRVPRAQQTKYLAALADGNALPGDLFSSVDKAEDKDGPFLPPEQSEARRKTAKEKLLSAIVSGMQGVQNAVVLYDVDVKQGLRREKILTASVNVRPRGSEPLTEQRVQAIRRLVASSIAGLEPEKVTVSDLSTGKTYYGGAGGIGNSLDDAYAVHKREYEQEWTEKVLNALSRIPGVTVTTNVELDKKQLLRKEEVKHDPKSVPYQTEEKTTTETSEGNSPGGRVGAVAQTANAPASLAASSGKGQGEQKERSEQKAVNAISSTRSEETTVGLTPQRVAVAVSIPASYFKKVWQERNPVEPGTPPKTPDPKELEAIRTAVLSDVKKQVATLLPPKVEGQTDSSDPVMVTEFQDITTPAPPEPGVRELVVGWLVQYWTTVGLMLLGLVSLLVLRSVVRSVAPPPAAPAVAPAAAAAVTAAEVEEEPPPAETSAPARRLKRTRKPGVSLKEELSDLVKEDPDAAASILRTWIGNAS
jgi:flagellar M-ring protein FliF